MMTDEVSYIVDRGPKAPAKGVNAAVTTDSAIVTETMMKILRSGGTAADAAVAGCMVQAVVEPFMTNHAGLVTLLYYDAASRRVYQLDSHGAHPSGLPPFRPIPQGHGPYSANPPSAIIPGFMPGLKALHERFCTKRWQDLCEDAVYWAERGHIVSSFEYSVMHSNEKFTSYFPEGRKYYNPNGFFPSVGEIFKPAGLDVTMQRVRDEGPDYMITGGWAKAFVAKANAMGWMITPEHMIETPPRWLAPLLFTYNEFEIATLSPPQATGLFCNVTLGILKHLGIRTMAAGSADHLWAMSQALRMGARHWEFAQDSSIYNVPVDEVVDDGYHAHLAKMIAGSRPKVDLSEHIRLTGDSPGGTGSDATAIDTSSGKPRLMDCELPSPAGSCEISAVDANGNWVQLMNTLQASGIPGQVVDGVPMVGSHATFGNLQAPMDSTLVKGAKVRNVMGNTLVLKDGAPVFSAGTPALPHFMIPQVLVNALDFRCDPYTAIDAPRMLPMTERRGIVIEDRISDGVVEDLHSRGIRVGVLPAYDYHMGSFSTIARTDDGVLTAVADPRRCGVAAAY